MVDDVSVLFSSLYKLHQLIHGIISLPFQPLMMGLQLDGEQLPVKCDLSMPVPNTGSEVFRGFPLGCLLAYQLFPIELPVKGWALPLFE